MSSPELARWILSQSFVPIQIAPMRIIEELQNLGVVQDADSRGLKYGEDVMLPNARDDDISRLFTMRRLEVQEREDEVEGLEPVEVETAESFDDMDLSDNLLRGIYSYGFERPSLIQQRSIQAMVTGRHLVGQACAGSGKTAAYATAALQRIDFDAQVTQVLLLAPGRELVLQIQKVFLALGDYLGLRCHACLGGTSVRDDIDRLRRRQHIVVGTPGRIEDMISKRHLRTGKVKMIIIDEVDSLLSSPNDRNKTFGILNTLPRGVQTCLFSTTVTPEIVQSLERRMPKALKVLFSKSELIPESIKHFYIDIEREEWKFDTLCDLYETMTQTQTLCFFTSRRKVDYIAEQMCKRDFTISCFHAELDQKERDLVMREFRSGSSRVLLTTSLLARGIDVQQVSLVINYDIPSSSAEYLHQAGRCARFGRKGVVINLAVSNDINTLKNFGDMYEIMIEEMPIDIQDMI
jgi:translation initiation factor 4A